MSKTHYGIKELNDDVNKIINSYLPDPIEIPEDGTDDTREYDAWLLTEEGKKYLSQDEEQISFEWRERESRIKRGIKGRGATYRSTGYEDEQILKWFINEKGELDNKYEPSLKSIRYNNNCCITCGRPHPKNNPYWKTQCIPCWRGDPPTYGQGCLIVED